MQRPKVSLAVRAVSIAIVAGAALPVCLGQEGAASAPASGPGAAQATAFDYRIEPLVDLYHYVREQATRRGDPDAPPEFAEAVAAAKAVCDKLGTNPLDWEPLDQHLMTCTTTAELKAAFEGLPEKLPKFRRAPVEARDEAVAYAEALAAVEAVYRAQLWPKHEPVIRAAREKIEQQFRPKEAECIAYMIRSLGLDDPRQVVPVYLVHRSTWPEAYTIKRPGGGGGLVFAAVARPEHAGTWLYETILHEATHALDLSADGQGGVFGQLRDRLRATGMNPRDPKFRSIPHTIMFIQAGETIRRVVDAAHVHYGVESNYYERTGMVATVELRVWPDYLDGKLTRDQAVDALVKALSGTGETGAGEP